MAAASVSTASDRDSGGVTSNLGARLWTNAPSLLQAPAAVLPGVLDVSRAVEWLLSGLIVVALALDPGRRSSPVLRVPRGAPRINLTGMRLGLSFRRVEESKRPPGEPRALGGVAVEADKVSPSAQCRRGALA
jgi:hypothetical protein